MNNGQQGWNAEDYARNSAAQFSWAQELIGKLELRGDEALLDIGCGDGKITAAVARLLPHGRVVGIDASQAMIELAQASFPQTAQPNLEFRRMDATALELPQIFDVAFSNAALHWVADQQAVLRGVRRCLRPGGLLLFQMGGKGNVAELLEVVQSIIESPVWRSYFTDFQLPYHFQTIERYEAWLTELGFRARRVELIPKDMQHDGTEALKGWLRTTWFPYTERLPPELRENFLNEIVERYTARHPVDSAGKTHVQMVRLEVEATAL